MQDHTFIHVDDNIFLDCTGLATTEYRTCNQLFGLITIITCGCRCVTDIDLGLPDMSQIMADIRPTTGGTIHITIIDTIIANAAATNRDCRLSTSVIRNIIDNISSTH